MTGQPDSFMEIVVNPERKVEKLFPRWEINRHGEGLKWVIDQNWGLMAKIGLLGQRPKFWPKKRESLLVIHHVLAMTGKSCSKKKVFHLPNKYQSLEKFLVIFWPKKKLFGRM